MHRRVGEWSYCRRICERCWQRHEKHEAETRRRFVRDNPPGPLLASLRDRNADEATRIAAMTTLVELGVPDAVPALCDQLEDPSESIRCEAAKVLGETKDARAVEPLCQLLQRSVADKYTSFFEEPSFLMSALANIGDPRAEEVISALLTDRRAYSGDTVVVDMDIRMSDGIADALERLGGLDLVFNAYERAFHSPDEVVRDHVTRDLGNIVWRGGLNGGTDVSGRHLQAVRRLLVAASRDQSEQVRYAGQHGLENFDY
ncbi:HEAT repeat domain-containing protein [Streptomyces sp. NPDC102441]|uniref:HEAT repeat domain-containing protein n=1 Tax=Streptomyces sp. NPDC102441 TaxID=3366176 RepID=UPI0037FCA107